MGTTGSLKKIAAPFLHSNVFFGISSESKGDCWTTNCEGIEKGSRTRTLLKGVRAVIIYMDPWRLPGGLSGDTRRHMQEDTGYAEERLRFRHFRKLDKYFVARAYMEHYRYMGGRRFMDNVEEERITSV